MLFNSLHFLVFFPLVTALYFALPHSRRWVLLLLASCYFYMALIPIYILILFLLILIDYLAALWMEGRTGASRKAILLLSLASNVGILALFKYFNFFSANLGLEARLSLILPIGLSFHTFQSMSYTIEVYRGTVKAERHLGIYALYVLFYPQLVAGPIERPQHLLTQFRREHRPDRERILAGLKLMLIGFFKKVAVADTLALSVNEVYRDPSLFSSASLLVACYLFAFQILYDFSGYTDIARGAAQVMGFDLVLNFNRPYAAKSIAEFWTRWHISLSSWFRDYLYIPLGGGRAGELRGYLNLIVVFLVSGLWHGANWTFVAWGAIHGAGLIVSRLAAKFGLRPRASLAWSVVSVAVTFHFVVFAWIFFRSASIAQAAAVLKGLSGSYDWTAPARELGFLKVALSAGLIVLTEAALWLQANGKLSRLAPSPFLRNSLSYAWIFAALAIIAARVSYDSTPQQFIYFQF